MPRILRPTVLGLVLTSAVVAGLIYSVTWRPDAKEVLAVSCPVAAPTLVAGQAIKIMTWNVQYLAGKRYVFWYNLIDGSAQKTKWGKALVEGAQTHVPTKNISTPD